MHRMPETSGPSSAAFEPPPLRRRLPCRYRASTQLHLLLLLLLLLHRLPQLGLPLRPLRLHRMPGHLGLRVAVVLEGPHAAQDFPQAVLPLRPRGTAGR